MKRWIGILFLFPPMLPAAPLGQTRSGASASKVKVQVVPGKVDDGGNQVITMNLAIDEGCYLYANPVGHKGYLSDQTTLKVSSKGKVETVKIDYPPGKPKEVYGDRIRVYEGNVTIRAQVRRNPVVGNPIQLTLKVNACKNKACFPPGTINVSVP